jgi:glycosyltransferase involved in cell wall biosynthesis
MPTGWRRQFNKLRQRLDANALRAITADLKPLNGSIRITFLPGMQWAHKLFQRPQQLARAFADLGCEVIYVQPWHIQHESCTNKELSAFVGARDYSERIKLLRVPPSALPLLLQPDITDAAIFAWPDQAVYLPSNPKIVLCYELIDDHSLIPRRPLWWDREHRNWVRRADIMVATADDLRQQVVHQRPDVLLLPNAACMEDWRQDTTPMLPADLIEPRRANSLVMYYGAIAEWFDWHLVLTAAQRHPDWSFVLIGMPYDGDVAKLMAKIEGHKNVFYLGAKAYNELASYLAFADVTIIPFVLNKLTHAVSPVKLFEYMAAGKPTVATPMQEITKYKTVFFANSADEFGLQLSRAIEGRMDPQFQSALRAEAEANTWRARAIQIRDAIYSKLPASRREQCKV